MVSCPKCGFEQESDVECLRCGIIYAKFKSPTELEHREGGTPSLSTPETHKPAFISRLFRVLPWLSLAITTTIILLILKQAVPLTIQIDPQASERVAEKMAQLQLALQSNERHVTSLNEAELNQWMRESLSIASTHQAQLAGIPMPAGQEVSVKDIQSALKDLQVNLKGNELRAYALFVLYGKTVSLQLDGTLETQNGYFRLKPTAGKIGSLPIPSSTLDHIVHRLFDAPQNREIFQLPPQIESLRIDNNALVIATR
jgi:hypothetical protein